jgi:radical SAM protein with 4Fe4S-binding SPASM domain
MGNIAAIEWFNHRKQPIENCCSCIENLYIDAAGKMYPCDMLMIQALAVHQVYHRPLDESLIDGARLWEHLSDHHRKRQLELKPCKTCPGRQHCSGGCMGRAYAAAGDFMAVEDRCLLRKSVYSRDP